LTPLSLGTVPLGSVTPGCTISPAESDNLLDLSWRHLSMQWNTTVSTSYPSVPTLTGLSLPSHLADTPQHQQQTSNLLTTAGWNMGGSALVRNHLLPQLSCTGSLGTGSGGTLSCTQSMPFSENQVYLFVRDTQSGWAYTASAISQYLLQTSSGGPGYNTAVVSTVNPATSSYPGNWSNATQTTAHVQVADYTPEACYANGAAGNGNLVAWARSPEYGGQPGPDDAYIGGAVSSSFLGNLTSGHFLLLQFALPSTPNTPCLKNGNPVYNCDLSGNEQLRYMSLTFLQPQGSPPAGAVVADPDNVTGQTSNLPLSLISIADSALAAATVSWNGFNLVNLVINTASNGLPSWLLESNGTPITQGVSPVLIDRNSNGDYDSYGLWVVNASLGGGVTVPYVVLDLSRFVGTSGTTALNSNGTAVTVPAFTTSQDLLIEMRTTLPNTSSGYSFPCSGAAVPYSTAEYTSLGGGGMMGPFAPYVISWAPGNSPVNYPNPNLPTTTQYCGDPGTAGPLLTNPIGNGTQGDFPRQYWPTGSNTGAANLTLNCPTSPSSSTSTPSIQYVSTQAPNAVDYTGGPTNCTTPTTCNQVILQSTERTEMPGGASWTPGIPLTIVGSGFGYFAYAASGQPFNASLPYASMGSAPPQIYIGYCPHGSYQCTPSTGITWDTTNTSCQVYINNWYDTSISLVLATTDDVQNIYQSQSPLLAGTYLSPLSDLTFDTLSAASGCQMTANDYLYFTITNPQSGNSNPTGLNQWFNAKILAATTTPTN
jgi:hypothetical protein